MVFTSIIGLTAIWFVWSCLSLFKNYRSARKIGLPIVIEPANSLNIIVFVANLLFQKQRSLAQIRKLLIHRLMRFSYSGWQFDQGHNIHTKIGPAFSLVTPGSIQIIVADADAAYDILTRRKDFIKPEKIYKAFNIFGPNLNSVEGPDWQRHRRLTAPSLNENVSSSVWQQSMKQARDILQSWKSNQADVSTTASDAATVALNVFVACGFGKSTDHGEHMAPSGDSDQLSYRDAVMLILRRYSVLIVLRERFLTLLFMPHAAKRLHGACQQFRAHVNAILSTEKESVGDSANLLSNLIRASDAEKNDSAKIGLTDEEIMGNMFIFTLAGHETTANTVATAIFYLARHPQYQLWVRQELEHVLGSRADTGLDYSTTFPRLKRCLALMLETLRIHGSVVFIPRSTHNHTQAFNVKDTTYTIPADTMVIIDNHAIQMDPKIWGTDVKEWQPDRWILGPGGKNAQSDSTLDSEQIYDPPSGAFIPWADGPRNCPGKKFSQVEFVAIMATLLRKHEVMPVVDVDKEATNEKLDRMLQDSGITSITLQIRHPVMVKLSWKELPPSS